MQHLNARIGAAGGTRLTGFGGWSMPDQKTVRLGLPRSRSAVSVKQRTRGASNAETLWIPIASLAAGNAALSDLDALREDRVGRRQLGLCHVPSGRRLGEYLARTDEAQLGTRLAVAREMTALVAPAVVEHEAAVRGYVPVFIDGTAIQWSTGRGSKRRGYDGTRHHRNGRGCCCAMNWSCDPGSRRPRAAQAAPGSDPLRYPEQVEAGHRE